MNDGWPGSHPNGERVGMRALRTSAAAGLLAALALHASPADATVVRALTLLEKTRVSALVVRGTAEQITPAWDRDGAAVQTLIRFRVDEVLKGDARPGQRIVLRQAGGKIGDFDHRVPGVSQWTPGERAILFLEPLGAQHVEIGIGIGKYEIVGDGKNDWVHHDPDVSVAWIEPGQPMRIEEAPRMEPVRLEQFTKRVRSYAIEITAPTRSKADILRPRATLPDPR